MMGVSFIEWTRYHRWRKHGGLGRRGVFPIPSIGARKQERTTPQDLPRISSRRGEDAHDGKLIEQVLHPPHAPLDPVVLPPVCFLCVRAGFRCLPLCLPARFYVHCTQPPTPPAHTNQPNATQPNHTTTINPTGHNTHRNPPLRKSNSRSLPFSAVSRSRHRPTAATSSCAARWIAHLFGCVWVGLVGWVSARCQNQHSSFQQKLLEPPTPTTSPQIAPG